jgi:hypothetical protein
VSESYLNALRADLNEQAPLYNLLFMKKIETVIHIHRPLEQVWDVLMDFAAYPEWNPFITSISGDPFPGNRIKVTAKLPGKKGMEFKPVVLKSEPMSELRWKGKLIFKGLFDGEHYFILNRLPNGSTALHHGERFSGILPPVLKGMLKKTEMGFQKMNVALKERCEAEYTSERIPA